MKTLRISDTTLSKTELTFREKSEFVKYLDRLGISVIETGIVPSDMAEILFVKNAASLVKDSILSVPVGYDLKSVGHIWEALKTAAKPRLQVSVPLSTAQMEYILHRKASNIVPLVTELITECRKYCKDVEFVAQDAVRADKDVLYDCLKAAISSGASTITVSDSEGCLLPDELKEFLSDVRQSVPEIKSVEIGIMEADTLGLAAACTFAVLSLGVEEIKVCCHGNWAAPLSSTAGIISARGDDIGLTCSVKHTEIKRILHNISELFQDGKKSVITVNHNLSNSSDITISAEDSIEDVIKTVEDLGYDLSEEDKVKVFASVRKNTGNKRLIGIEELEAIIASESMQVPSAYSLESYSVTCGNTIDILAHVKLRKGSEVIDGISMGDGPIDASFLAIEKVTGYHYELDDFQIKAITRGREAMGQTIVKLRKDGKIYSGRGISTDIVGSGINAYINALNKIVWEEENK